ncbi:MAG: 50S ribosomal protein L29 [Planctomycetes bacterium]|nr:50S ribosomal protein L29 [Planctomycetota bacterium]
MNKASEIREMPDEQIRLTWKDAAETLFRLRLQAQTEKLKSPAQVKQLRRTIARCQTVLRQRGTLEPPATEQAAGAAKAVAKRGRVKMGRGRPGAAAAKAKSVGGAAGRPRVQQRTQMQKRGPGG